MNQLPKIFGIVPTYNHWPWLIECLDGFVNQTIKPDALCIVDDGSTDSTWPNLLSLCTNIKDISVSGNSEPEQLKTAIYKNLPCVLVKFAQNHGPAISRNYAIRTFQKDNENSILAFCDSDDIYEPKKIEESLPYFMENPHVGMVYSDYTTFNKLSSQMQFKEPYSKLRLSQECLGNMDSLFRMSAFMQCGYFDESLRVCEDFDRYLSISNKFLLCHIPTPLVRIRVGTHSSSSTITKQVWEDNYARVMKKHFAQK